MSLATIVSLREISDEIDRLERMLKTAKCNRTPEALKSRVFRKKVTYISEQLSELATDKEIDSDDLIIYKQRYQAVVEEATKLISGY